MTHQDILTKIQNILMVYLPEGSNELTESTRLVDDLGINSARLVDIVLDLEDKFGISIDDSAMVKMSTIGDAIHIVSSLLGGMQEAAVKTAGSH